MFRSIETLLQQAEKNAVSISEIILRMEIEENNTTREAVIAAMKTRLDVMRRSVEKGIHSPVQSLSGLSDGSAYRLWNRVNAPGGSLTGTVISHAVARAMAVGEVNAGMGCIVATPTAGAAGILPAVLFTLEEVYTIPESALIQALFTAGGFGAVIATRANVAGAKGGCQAETGSGAAMASAAAVELMGGSPRQAAHAAAITLSNMLGLVCDPVAGLVEFPCIKRNGAGAAQALVAAEMALAGITSIIPIDEVIDAMGSIGERMDERLRETAQGGLAATPTGRALAEKIWKSFH